MSDAPVVNTSPDTPRPPLDEAAAWRWLEGRVPHTLGAEAWLHGEVARRMESRLQWMRQAPLHCVDWSPSLGGWQAGDLLMQRYPQTRLQRVETATVRLAAAKQRLTTPRWQFWKTAPELLSQAEPGQARMVWANMQLHAHPQPEVLLRQWHAALAVDGFLMFSCLGPDSLREIRTLYADLGWPSPAHAFTDMHDWGDMLVQAGFAEPVMDMERITLTYADAGALLADLRALGRNLSPARHPGCRGRAWGERLRALLSSGNSPLRSSADGRLSLTFEVIYGHALKPAPRARVLAQTELPLQDLRHMLGQRPARD